MRLISNSHSEVCELLGAGERLNNLISEVYTYLHENMLAEIVE